MYRLCKHICDRKNDIRIAEAAFLSAHYQRFASVKSECAVRRSWRQQLIEKLRPGPNCKLTASLLRSSLPKISEGECNERRVE